MRAAIQRVKRARVTVGPTVVGEIDLGLVALIAFTVGDGPGEMTWMADKLVHLRIFPGPGGHLQQSVLDLGGAILVVSEFTLYGDLAHGRRPDFHRALAYEPASFLYHRFVTLLSVYPVRVAEGRFGQEMEVELVNWGPVTLILERAPSARAD